MNREIVKDIHTLNEKLKNMRKNSLIELQKNEKNFPIWMSVFIRYIHKKVLMCLMTSNFQITQYSI